MPPTELLMPDDLEVARLQSLYDDAGLETMLDSEGDLAVTSGVTCYAIPSQQKDRIQLLAFVGVKDEVEYGDKMEFANRVNNQVSTVRARVNRKGTVLFDSHIPVEGGITGSAIVQATQFFLQATAYAANQCDDDGIVR